MCVCVCRYVCILGLFHPLRTMDSNRIWYGEQTHFDIPVTSWDGGATSLNDTLTLCSSGKLTKNN